MPLVDGSPVRSTFCSTIVMKNDSLRLPLLKILQSAFCMKAARHYSFASGKPMGQVPSIFEVTQSVPHSFLPPCLEANSYARITMAGCRTDCMK